MSPMPVLYSTPTSRVFDLTFALQGILRHLRLGHVDDTVDVERDLLGVGGPALIAETVVEFPVGVRGERVVFVGDGLLVVLAVSHGILDLDDRFELALNSSFSTFQTKLQFHHIHPRSHFLLRCASGQRPNHRTAPRESNRGSQNEGAQAYPEVDIDISTSTKFPVTDLEGHGHQIILVQVLVEAFSRVRLELDGVCGGGGEPPQRGDEEGGG